MTKLNALLALLAWCFCATTALAQPQFLVVPQEPDATIGETVNVDIDQSETIFEPMGKRDRPLVNGVTFEKA